MWHACVNARPCHSTLGIRGQLSAASSLLPWWGPRTKLGGFDILSHLTSPASRAAGFCTGWSRTLGRPSACVPIAELLSVCATIASLAQCRSRSFSDHPGDSPHYSAPRSGRSTHVVVGGQFAPISSLLPPCGQHVSLTAEPFCQPPGPSLYCLSWGKLSLNCLGWAWTHSIPRPLTCDPPASAYGVNRIRGLWPWFLLNYRSLAALTKNS